jgi:hypothetical protein
LESIGKSTLKTLLIKGEWDHEVFAANAWHLRNLTCLQLLSRFSLDDESLRELGRHCKKLEVVWLSRVFRDEALSSFLEGAKDTLRILHLDMYYVPTLKQIEIIGRCTHLEDFRLQKLSVIGSGQIALELKPSKVLKTLSLVDFYLSPEAYVQAFSSGRFQHLERLYLSGTRVNELVSTSIADNCPRLTYLNVPGTHACQVIPVLQKCEGLTDLIVRSAFPEVFRDAKVKLSRIVLANFGFWGYPRYDFKIKMRSIMPGAEIVFGIASDCPIFDYGIASDCPIFD